MSVATVRGGYPHIFAPVVIDTTGRVHKFPFMALYLLIRVTVNPCKVYFTEDDFTNDTNYILIPVPSAATPNGEWQGPAEINGVWLKGSGGSSTVELVAFQRRG